MALLSFPSATTLNGTSSNTNFGKNIFFQYTQLTVSEGRHEVNCDFDPTNIDDDLLF